MTARHVWVAILMAFVPSVAAADKLDDALTKRDQTADTYNAAIEKYRPLQEKWVRYYKPINDQYPVMVAAHKKADDECAKNKRTKACRDLTMAYGGELKAYNWLVSEKDRADPKHEFSLEALKPLETDMLQKKDAYDKVDSATRKLFEEAYKKVRTKADKDQIDAKLANKEQKRADKFVAGRGKEADAKNPPNTSRTGSTSSGDSSSHGDNGAMESARRTAGALGNQ